VSGRHEVDSDAISRIGETEGHLDRAPVPLSSGRRAGAPSCADRNDAHGGLRIDRTIRTPSHVYEATLAFALSA
jgi:hypothetical protein